MAVRNVKLNTNKNVDNHKTNEGDVLGNNKLCKIKLLNDPCKLNQGKHLV